MIFLCTFFSGLIANACIVVVAGAVVAGAVVTGAVVTGAVVAGAVVAGAVVAGDVAEFGTTIFFRIVLILIVDGSCSGTGSGLDSLYSLNSSAMMTTGSESGLFIFFTLVDFTFFTSSLDTGASSLDTGASFKYPSESTPMSRTGSTFIFLNSSDS